MFAFPRHVGLVLVILGSGWVAAGCSTTDAVKESQSLPAADSVETSLLNAAHPPLFSPTKSATRLFVRGLTKAYSQNYDEAIIYYQQALKGAANPAAVYAALADAYAKQKQYPSAINYARQALVSDSSRVTYHYTLAELQQQAGKDQNAQRTYQALLARFPGERRAHLALANLQAQTGATQAAIGTYQQFLKQRGEDVHIRYRLLRLYRQENDLNGVVQTLEAIVEQTGFNENLYRMLAAMYREDGQLEKAAQLLQVLQKHARGDLDTALQLADMYHKLGDSAKADSLLNKTLQTQGTSPEALFKHAKALYFQPGGASHKTSVQQLLTQVLLKKPGHTDARFLLGTVYLQQGRYVEAMDELERVVTEDPKSLMAWVRALMAGVQGQQYQRTTNLAKKALAQFPENFTLLRLAGYACFENGCTKTAVQYLSRALSSPQADTVDAKVRSDLASMLGMLYDRLDNKPDSDRFYQQALDWNPSNPTALNNYAYSLASRGQNLKKALEMARKAVDLQPKNSSFLDTLGWVYFQMNRLDEARVWVGKALEVETASATIYEHYGDIHHELGHSQKAVKYWHKAVEIDPNRSSLEQKIKQVTDQ